MRFRYKHPLIDYTLLGITAGLALISSKSEAIPIEEQLRTLYIRADYVNQLNVDVPNPEEGSSAAFFGGHAYEYAVPDSGDDPVVPTGGGISLIQSGFGQPFAQTVPYPEFNRDAIDEARELLFYADAPPEERDLAAFRYNDLLYGMVDGNVVNLIETRLDIITIDDLYGEEERARADEAERFIRNALRHSPSDRELRNALLDILLQPHPGGAHPGQRQAG